LDDHPRRVERDFGEEAALALGVLDALAREPGGVLAFESLVDRVRLDEDVSAAYDTVERSQVLSIAHRLQRDNDLDISGNGAVTFTSTVARDAWRGTRLLG